MTMARQTGADVEQQIRALAVGRIALGVALLTVPRPLLSAWFGRGAGSAMAGVMARSAGGRDLALGLGTLFALRHGSPVRGWIEATMLSDAADAVALALGARELPKARALLPVVPTLAVVGFERMWVSRLAGAGDGTAPESTGGGSAGGVPDAAAMP